MSDSYEVRRQSSDKHDTAAAGVRDVGLQGSGVFEEVKKLAGPAWKPLSTPRRAKQEPGSQPVTSCDESPFTSDLSTRWLRKRYQNLLGKTPVLTYAFKETKDDRRPAGQYEVSLAPSAISSHIRYGANRLPPVDESSLSWIQLAEGNGIQESETTSVKQRQGQNTITTTQNNDNEP
jgi:hypothetical protein